MDGLFKLDVSKPITKTKKQVKKKEKSIEENSVKTLLGEDLVIKQQEKVTVGFDDITDDSDDTLVEKVLKSKKLSLPERLALITRQVLRVLYKQKNHVLVIKTREQFDNYISKCISNGVISVDTETNNSLDPVTCQIMGLCLYTPGEKQAYIPVNHTDLDGNRLEWQLTEAECNYQLQRIIDAKTYVIMHNGKFDYEVIKCTCGLALKPDWDTMIAARLLNENEPAGLKEQYIQKIDPTQARYKIDKLFDNVAYAFVDPEIFAIYAASDAFLTYRLYEYQKVLFDDPAFGPHMDITGKHKVNGLRWVFHEVEMPIVVVTAEMELAGVKIDTKLGARLKEKYQNSLEKIDAEIDTKLEPIMDTVRSWTLTPIANERTKQYQPKKTKLSRQKIEERYPEYDKELGKRFKYGKSRHDQLSFPINLASPIQLAILFYDVLACESESKKAPRGTGEAELKKLAEQLTKRADKLAKEENKVRAIAIDVNEVAETLEAELAEEFERVEVETTQQNDEDINSAVSDKVVLTSEVLYHGADLCKAILERRGIVKLLTTYIDVIPVLAQHWPDGRIRFHLNSMGTDTGRYSSGGKIKYYENGQNVTVSGINIQNIPAKVKELRLLFTSETKYTEHESENNTFTINEYEEVETASGWKYCNELQVGDQLVTDSGLGTISAINYADKKYLILV